MEVYISFIAENESNMGDSTIWEVLTRNKKWPQFIVAAIFIFLLHSLAILIKSTDQAIGNHLSRTAFDLMTLDHVNQFTIFK